MDEAFPPLHAYALAHRCSSCGAEPGADCDAPMRNASLAKVDRTRQQFGLEPVTHDPLKRMHAPRIDAGHRHLTQDQVKAPWPEDRVPGQRYDTLSQPAPKPVKKEPTQPKPGADLHDRAAAIFGRSLQHGVHWPYGLETPSRRNYRDDEDGSRYAAALRDRRAAQQTITEWADTYGLKRSEAGCCPRWLQRRVSRRCSSMNSACARYGTGGDNLDRGWLDHVITWLQEGKPAVLTSAPYSLGQDDRDRLAWSTNEDSRLRFSLGPGWYGFGTMQVVVWRSDVIPTVEPA
jgi:hypothetical protein